MLMIGCMAVGTVIFILFGILFVSAGDNLTTAMLQCCCETQRETIKKVRLEMEFMAEQIREKPERQNREQIRKAKKLRRKMTEAQKLLDNYEKGKLNVLDMIPTAGYRLLQLAGWDSTNPTVKELYQKCRRFKEKREAMNYTCYLLGALFGYGILGAGAFFVILGICLAVGLGARAFVAAVIVLVIFFLLGYLPYDNVSAIVNQRAEEIEHTFPQAVSKLALLTVAGMEVSQAWRLTSKSGRGTLYEEMDRVLIDLDNNVSPTEAYSGFLARCNNKYTTKLATCIIQNLSKGNAEIVGLLLSLNNESWQEHKHNARRMGEKIQSRLLIPTLLLFVGIIILVIVPVMSGFSF